MSLRKNARILKKKRRRTKHELRLDSTLLFRELEMKPKKALLVSIFQSSQEGGLNDYKERFVFLFFLQFVSHPFLFKRVKMRWQRGSPFKSAGILHIIPRLLFIVFETILTPLLLPLIGYTFYRDQKRTQNRSHKYEKPELVSGGSDQTKEPLHMTRQDIDRTKDLLGLTQLDRDQTSNQLEMTSQDKDQTKDQQGLTQQEGDQTTEVSSQDKDQTKDELDQTKGQVEMTSQDREQKKEPTELTKEDGDWNNEQGGMSSEENDRPRDFFGKRATSLLVSFLRCCRFH